MQRLLIASMPIRLVLAVCICVLFPTWAHAGLIENTIELSGWVEGSGSDPADDKHAKEYSGKYAVKFAYSIATKLQNGKIVFDPSGKSTVTLTDTSAQFGSFTTLPITITSANLSQDGLSALSFSFASTDWYPNASSDGIKNDGLDGSINISGKQSNLVAKYIQEENLTKPSIYTYTYSMGAAVGPPTPELPGWTMGLTSLRGACAAAPRDDSQQSALGYRTPEEFAAEVEGLRSWSGAFSGVFPEWSWEMLSIASATREP